MPSCETPKLDESAAGREGKGVAPSRYSDWRWTVVLLLIGDQILADGQGLQSLLLCQRLTAGFPLGKLGFCSSMKIDGGFDVMLEFAGVFFVLFARRPAAEKVKELLAQDFGEEKLASVGDAAYLYIPGTYGRGKLSNNFWRRSSTLLPP
jgi:hypothetical protein